MKKVMVLVALFLVCCVLFVDAAPKKVAVVGRISWAPSSEGADAGNRDFDVMHHFSMTDIMLGRMIDGWGYLSILMPDYVVQFMLNNGEDVEARGYDAYVNPGVYMMQPNFLQDDGYELVYVTGTCWSSIAPPLQNVPVPVIMGEHSCVGTRAKLGSLGMFFGEASSDHRGVDTIVLTEAGKTHELTAGLPDEIQVWGDGPEGPPENPSDCWDGLHDDVDSAAPGTTVLAVWADDETKAALAVVETGGELADGSNAPARRVMPYCNGGKVRPAGDAELPPVWIVTYDYMTPAGEDVMRRSVRWALGESPTGVAKWPMR